MLIYQWMNWHFKFYELNLFDILTRMAESRDLNTSDHSHSDFVDVDVEFFPHPVIIDIKLPCPVILESYLR